MPPTRNNSKPQIVTFKQLLTLAHDKGLRGIETEALDVTDKGAFFKATVTMNDGGKYTGHADASKTNVKEAMLNCLPRMAETRAIVRALRLAVNVGEVAAEELEDYDGSADYTQAAPTRKPAVDSSAPMTEQQEVAIRNIAQRKGIEPPEMTNWTQQQAADCIATLNKQPA